MVQELAALGNRSLAAVWWLSAGRQMGHRLAESDGDPRTEQGPEKDQAIQPASETPVQQLCRTRSLQFRFNV